MSDEAIEEKKADEVPMIERVMGEIACEVEETVSTAQETLELKKKILNVRITKRVGEESGDSRMSAVMGSVVMRLVAGASCEVVTKGHHREMICDVDTRFRELLYVFLPFCLC